MQSTRPVLQQTRQRATYAPILCGVCSRDGPLGGRKVYDGSWPEILHPHWRSLRPRSSSVLAVSIWYVVRCRRAWKCGSSAAKVLLLPAALAGLARLVTRICGRAAISLRLMAPHRCQLGRAGALPTVPASRTARLLLAPGARPRPPGVLLHRRPLGLGAPRLDDAGRISRWVQRDTHVLTEVRNRARQA